MIGQNVLIYDHDHAYRMGTDEKKENFTTSTVTIGQNVWIGSGAIVLKGSVIGDNCVIGAGSIIKGSIPSDSICFDKRDLIISKI